MSGLARVKTQDGNDKIVFAHKPGRNLPTIALTTFLKVKSPDDALFDKINTIRGVAWLQEPMFARQRFPMEYFLQCQLNIRRNRPKVVDKC